MSNTSPSTRATMADYSTLPASVKDRSNVRSYTISVDETKLQDFKTLWRLSPLVQDTYENQDERETEGHNFGLKRSWLSATKSYMETEFDWRKQEAYLNTFPQYQTTVQDDDGTLHTIHFAALFSQKKDAIPLARLSGWPCCFAESLPLLRLLQQKYSPADLPYHIILPSQPGWPLSSPPPLHKNWTYADSARILHKLMTSSLGFASYALSGGDIGAGIARIMASGYQEVKVLHTNYAQMPQPDGAPAANELDGFEAEAVRRGEEFLQTGTAYGRMQGTRPATLGAVLAASPVGLLAWMGEKYVEWVGAGRAVGVEDILTAVCLYWFTGASATTLYPYREDYLTSWGKKGYLHGQEELYVDKPFGYSYFPGELVPCPKAWVETSGRLVWYRRHETGGHFPSLERSDALLKDVEDFLGEVWK